MSNTYSRWLSVRRTTLSIACAINSAIVSNRNGNCNRYERKKRLNAAQTRNIASKTQSCCIAVAPRQSGQGTEALSKCATTHARNTIRATKKSREAHKTSNPPRRGLAGDRERIGTFNKKGRR